MYSASHQSIECSLYDMRLERVDSLRQNFEGNLAYHQVLHETKGIIDRILVKNAISPERVFSVSYSGSGIIDTQAGVVRQASGTDWEANLPLRDDLQKCLQLPCRVYFDNGCRYLSLAEMQARNLSADQSMATIFSAEAIGGSLVRNGAIVTSGSGFTGEFGYLLVAPEGQGNSERSFSGRAPGSRMVKECCKACTPETDSALQGSIRAGTLTAREVFQAADDGDRFARTVVSRMAYFFSIAVTNIAYTCDTDLIVLQGDYATGGAYFMQELRREIDRYCSLWPHKEIRVEYSRLNFEHGRRERFLYGSAVAARQEWLRHVYDSMKDER